MRWLGAWCLVACGAPKVQKISTAEEGTSPPMTDAAEGDATSAADAGAATAPGQPASGIAPEMRCATAVHEGRVFRGTLDAMANDAWSLDGTWQDYTPSREGSQGTAQRWSGTTDPVSMQEAPASLDPGALHLTLHATRLGWAASGVVQHGEHRVAISCVQGEVVPLYRYDDGACTDTAGAEGLNTWPVQLVRETRLGECNRFEGIQLNEGLLDYPKLTGWNLRGARLDGADLAFGNLVDAQLEGAQMGTMTYGYAHISGTVDAHTTPPEQGCRREGDAIACAI